MNEYKDSYLLSEVKELCNFSTAQMKKSINDLLDKNLLCNSKGRLILTSESETLLKEKGLINISITDLFQQDTVTLEFIDEPLSFEDIYIPKNFKL
ncbi:putative transcriptional regulator [Bacillus luteolus]|nr:putative transcriptional regulator [Cytobacillus luteolus]